MKLFFVGDGVFPLPVLAKKNKLECFLGKSLLALYLQIGSEPTLRCAVLDWLVSD
jgi:hypothetical protein